MTEGPGYPYDQDPTQHREEDDQPSREFGLPSKDPDPDAVEEELAPVDDTPEVPDEPETPNTPY